MTRKKKTNSKKSKQSGSESGFPETEPLSLYEGGAKWESLKSYGTATFRRVRGTSRKAVSIRSYSDIEELKAASTNVDKFIDVANKYTDLKELTPEVLRVFIAKVVIHECECKWSKASEQQIDIYFRYVGKLTAEQTKQAV